MSVLAATMPTNSNPPQFEHRQEVARQVIRELHRPWMAPAEIEIQLDPPDLIKQRNVLLRDRLAARVPAADADLRLAALDRPAPLLKCTMVVQSPYLFFEWHKNLIHKACYFLNVSEAQLDRHLRFCIEPRSGLSAVRVEGIYRNGDEMDSLFKALFLSLREFPI